MATNLNHRVTHILSEYPLSRENYAQFMNAWTRGYNPQWDGDFTKLPSTEGITRAVRHAKASDPSLEGIGHFNHKPLHHLAA